MYQNSFLGHNVDIKDNKFDNQLPLYNITYEEMQEYMFIFLLNDFCSNILCWFFFKSNLN